MNALECHGLSAVIGTMMIMLLGCNEAGEPVPKAPIITVRGDKSHTTIETVGTPSATKKGLDKLQDELHVAMTVEEVEKLLSDYRSSVSMSPAVGRVIQSYRDDSAGQVLDVKFTRDPDGVFRTVNWQFRKIPIGRRTSNGKRSAEDESEKRRSTRIGQPQGGSK
jgi:hypothetical protein